MREYLPIIEKAENIISANPLSLPIKTAFGGHFCIILGSTSLTHDGQILKAEESGSQPNGMQSEENWR